ncbi:cyclic pyranopterin phosphate synthase [Hamadaea flava]|uniref:Cyclic pyranopterin monophosphate synthase n=1 Tax=Hamadaea flava TaxID=1742688 RepID=A0ABV8LEW7_9ACTN|nr:bifunctional molybdenum cofactor biosynthesis protein MoaC/MoaB [Hamadaea flava]MCP2326024.1 cyclic pyranopterin phosphate synthase [Hamadaea flava]
MDSQPQLTHVDAAGSARMVDVSAKEISVRSATAAGHVRTTPEVLALLSQGGLPKGDALGVARLAGIMAAKRTPDLVPLCHPIAIHGVAVEVTPADDRVEISATVRTADRTGVEMEALTCVAVAGLALIDMIKAVDPGASIENVRVLRKEGGKTGLWSRERPLAGVAVTVVVASTRAATGVYADRSGPILTDGLRELGAEVSDPVVVADGEPLRAALVEALAARPEVIVTSGGTGISPTDRTPEITRELIDREIPGLAQAVRANPAVPTAALSRGIAGVAGQTLVVNLPGSTGGAKDGLAVLGRVLRHAVDQIQGGDHG